ncbi:MAG: rhodanese-like domain-containing protein, partial [Deltaproteobacteria bacterium]|nr:rhodanese-like domain-containing protein [Deltaproteobacteria bacterium]
LLAESRLAEVEQIKRRFLAGREGMIPVDREKLLRLMREEAVTVLDVRPSVEYNAGHIAGALSIPLRALQQHLSDLPRDQEIVAYCRGPYCVLSVLAVEMLRAQGFNAVRLEEGIQDLRTLGFPIIVNEEI